VRLRVGIVCAERFLKLRPGDAQVILRSSSRQVGPQQAEEEFTAMCMLRFDQKIRQQSDRLAVGERDRPQLAMLDLQAAE